MPRLYQKLSGKRSAIGRNSEKSVFKTAPKVKDILLYCNSQVNKQRICGLSSFS